MIRNYLNFSAPNFIKGFFLQKSLIALVVSSVFVAGCLFSASKVEAGTNISVNSALDTQVSSDGSCTLREAIRNANQDSEQSGGDCLAGQGQDTITFNITAGGFQSIAISDVLLITQALTIDGFSQPGSSSNGSVAPNPLQANLNIEVNGANMPDNSSPCFWLQNVSDVTIKGLVINSCARDGIRLSHASNTKIHGNYIGVDRTGLIAKPNGRHQPNFATGVGIFIEYSDYTYVGGLNSNERNIISSNQFGEIFVNSDTGATDSSSHTTVQGNYIGLAADGVTPMPAGYSFGHGNSLLITHSANDLIGGSDPQAKNVIASSSEYGISFRDGCAFSRVENNNIGTDYTGTRKMLHTLGKGHPGAGISISTISNGGYTRASHNIDVVNNILSGNSNDANTDYKAAGLLINDGAHSVRVRGNYLGTNQSNTKISNQGSGIRVTSTEQYRSRDITIGGELASERNTISYNQEAGINIVNADSTVVKGNTLTSNLPNEVSIGGHGITQDIVVQNNQIGINHLGQPQYASNASSAIALTGDVRNSFIGSGIAGKGNQIGSNPNQAAITVQHTGNGRPIGNAITGNRFSTGQAMPVDLFRETGLFSNGVTYAGPTRNDLNDIDLGPNNLLNFPVISKVVKRDGMFRITFSLDINDNEAVTHDYRLDFYAGTLNRSNNLSGDARYHLGSVRVSQDVREITISLSTQNIPSTAKYISGGTTQIQSSSKDFSNSSEISPSRAILQ